MVEEEDFAGSIPQGLFLMNGQMLQAALGARRGTLLADLMRREHSDDDRVEALWLAAYGRKPENAERGLAKRFVKLADAPEQGYEDLFWSLLNSAEFMTNH